MKKSMRQFFQKGLSGILCAAMVLTSISIPEITAYASQTELEDEVEMTAETNEEVSEDISGGEDNDAGTLDSNLDKEDTDDAEGESDTDGVAGNTVEAVDIVGVAEVDKLEAEVSADNTTVENLLENGDFENISDWSPVGWVHTWEGFKAQASSPDEINGNYVTWWVDAGTAETEISISQTIDVADVDEGIYMISADVAGDHPEEKIYLIVNSVTSSSDLEESTVVELVKVDLGEGTGWGNWTEISTVFEVPSNNEGDIVVSIEGKIGADAEAQSLYLDNVELTFAMPKLEALYAEAEAVTKDENEYTEDSLEKLSTAMSMANELIERLSGSEPTTGDINDINNAYAALKNALDNMEIDKVAEEPVEITFYYYADNIDADDELAVAVWDNSTSISFSEGTKKASWAPSSWEDAECYLMEETELYDGWYSIGLVFNDTTNNGLGFDIYSKVRDNTIFQCSYQYEGKEIYAELISGDAETYAVKKFGGSNKLYAGDDVITVMRNITFYVYNEEGTPLIEALDSLKTVDDSGDIYSLVEDYSETWGKFYLMESDTSNWYYLTFSVPSETSSDVFQLYVTQDDSHGEWEKNFRQGTADAYSVDITPVFSGNIYYKDGELSNFKDITINLGMLKTLIEEAETITDQDNYTIDTWTIFKEALSSAKDVVAKFEDEDPGNEDTEDEEITNAFNSLKTAMNNLKEKGRTVTFNYYVGDTDGKGVGIYQWSSNDNISSEAALASWKAWGTDEVYAMTSAGYSGWYTIDLTFTGSVADSANFQVMIEDNSTAAFKCGTTGDSGNIDIYTELFSGTATTYAVKMFGDTAKLYKGETEVNTAMRNVTLYVYSTDATPAIGAGNELFTINESTGASDKVNVSDNINDIYYYQMEEVTGKDGWYSLIFSAPVPADGSNEICALYTYSDSTYTPVKKFISEDPTTETTDSVNFTPVFEGNVYYNNGQFYASMELAEGITLKMLKDLLESEEVTAIVNNKDKYEETLWNAFNTAKENAEAVVKECNSSDETSGDDYTSEDITNAYAALQSAINNMEEKPDEVIFYYYNDSVADDEELGLTIWGSDNSYSTAASYDDWYIWNAGDTHKMTQVSGYSGWYSIPIVFVSGGSWPGFEIYSHKSGDAADDTKWLATYEVDTYPKLENGETAYAVKNGKYYYGKELVTLLMRNVTLYVYNEETVPALGTINEITAYVDESNSSKVPVSYSDKADNVYYYNLKGTEDEDWYSIMFSAPVAGENYEIGKLYTKNDTTYDSIITFIEGTTTEDDTVDLTPYFGKTIYYKNGGFYDSIPVTLEDLVKLIEEAKALKKEDEAAEENGENIYLHADDGGKWDAFTAKIEAAEAVANADPAPTDSEIQTAYNDLKTAMKELVVVPQRSETISVERVAISDDFITGADLSSYVSLKESGVVFKDKDGNALSDTGFFEMLYEGGTNWVRIRIWNDPYDSNGNGYGGGNSDLAKAKIIGKLATDAGMRVLIDFHYSDFWADPSKQDAPKAWEDYTIEQKVDSVYNYTLESLKALKAAGVDVGMVQVGNETNNGICGEKTWDNMAKIFTAGSKAVKAFDENCLVALHFADPSSSAFLGYASKLDTYGVEYDVFAASYYPFWHGDAHDDMNNALTNIAKTYGKKVMVAETSWVTTWEDGDGHSNTSPKTTQTLYYPVSVQGQADEIRDVVNEVNKINDEVSGNPAIGVFYWEPAWISPYYVYNGTTIDQSLYSKNKAAWEKYGSGWASSYAIEYDPVDAGQWYGGSAVDNQAWFDFNGQALETAWTYSYIRTGAVATGRVNAIANVESEIELKVNVGDTIVWPSGNDIVVTYNDGSKAPEYDDDGNVKDNSHHVSTKVEWDEDQVELVSTDKTAVFTVDGKVTCEYYIKDGETATKTETYDVTLTIDVLSTSNILVNEGFENGTNSWNLTWLDGTASNTASVTGNDPHSGSYGMHFWNADALHFTVEQTVSAEDLKPGTYTAGGFLQGNGASSKDVQTLYVIVTDSNGVTTQYEKTCSLNGWLNWVNPEITNIKVSEGDALTVGMEILSTVGGAWGTIDDMYLYGKYGVNLSDIKNGIVNVSNMEPDSGEIVRIAAMPENGYYLSELKLTGENVGENTLQDETGLGTSAYDSASKTATLTYNSGENKSDEPIQAHFKMPEGMVTLDATFTAISFSPAVSLDNVTVKDFTANSEGKYVYDYNQEYTGKKLELDLELSYAGYKLTSTDYTAKYKDNTKVTTESSMAEITITAKGKKFTGSRILYFNIVDTKVDISKAKAVLVDDDPNKVDTYYYTGTEIEPVVTGLTDKSGETLKGKDGSTALTVSVNKDYSVYYQKNINVGKATMTVIANSESTKIKGSFTQTFTIAKCPITDRHITVSGITGAVYTGSKVTPNVTVKYDNKVLQKGKDYTVTYKNNVNVSTGASTDKKPSLKITGKGNYIGTTTEYPFEITPKNISDHGIKVTADDIAENKAPKIILKNGTKTLSLNKQYRITKILREAKGESPEEIIYQENADGTVEIGKKPTDKIGVAGTYEVTLSGIEKGGYNGTSTVKFRVLDKDHLLSNYKIVLPKTKTYIGSEIVLKAEGDNPELKVTNKNGTVTLEYGEDYTVSYEDVNGNKTNIKTGNATVTVTGIGEYAGTKTAKFKIAKRSVISGSSDDEKASITYEIKEDTLLDKVAKKTEDGEKLYLPYTGYAWTPELDIYTTNNGVKKLLTKGVDYTITYKDNLKAGADASVTIKGKGNYSGTVKFNNVFTVKDVTLDDFVITVSPVEYNGKALKPAINFVYKETGTVIALKSGTAYGVKYTNNKNVASIESSVKPTVTIIEKGLNVDKKGTAKTKLDIPFTITTARITYASVSEVKVQTYNGKPVKPKLTIKVNGKGLKEGTDYVVIYTGNSRPNDKAKAKIIGIGNYSGTVTKEFVIK